MQCVHGIEPGGARRGIETKDNADGHRHRAGDDHGGDGHHRGPASEIGDKLGEQNADDDTGQPAADRDERRLDAGFLGMSIQTLPWDKIGGTRDLRSRPLPSTFARWSEYRRLTRLLRARGRIFQATYGRASRLSAASFHS